MRNELRRSGSAGQFKNAPALRAGQGREAEQLLHEIDLIRTHLNLNDRQQAGKDAFALAEKAILLACHLQSDDFVSHGTGEDADPSYAVREASEYQYPELSSRDVATPAKFPEPSIFEGVPSASVFENYQLSHSTPVAQEMTAESLLILVERCERMMRSLHQAMEEYDMIKTKGLAYDLKNFCIGHGALPMSETCKHLESVVLEKKWTQAKVLWEVLVQEYNKYQQML